MKYPILKVRRGGCKLFSYVWSNGTTAVNYSLSTDSSTLVLTTSGGIYYSTDGAVFNSVSVPNGIYADSIFDGSLFYASYDYNNTHNAYSSSNGISWTASPNISFTNPIYSVGVCKGSEYCILSTYNAAGRTAELAHSSSATGAHSVNKSISSSLKIPEDIFYDGTYYIIPSSGGFYYSTSASASSWTYYTISGFSPPTEGTFGIYAGGYYVFISSDATSYAYSSSLLSGYTVKTNTPSTTLSVNRIEYKNGSYFVLCSSGIYYTSSSVSSLLTTECGPSSQPWGTSANLYDIEVFNGKYYIASQYYIYSSNL